jgi:cell division protein FtsX
MVRLFLIATLIGALIAIVVILASTLHHLINTGKPGLHPAEGHTKDQDMASSGIQKAAYIALIIVLFGVASGWLGGL